MDVNFQKELDRKMNLWRDGDVHPSLLLPSCCAPCSSYCLTYLADVFDITLYFYNPNITEKSEYDHRLSELVRLAREMPLPRKVVVEPGPWDPDRFFEMAKGLEDAPERGARCVKCYTMRLDETARVAREMKADFFATTLTLSPLKDARVINSIGSRLTQEGSATYLETDFKKNGGYQKSIELSKEYGLYRQNYCGCVYSRR